MSNFSQINDALLGSAFDGLTAAMDVLAARSQQRREQKVAKILYEGLQKAEDVIEQLLRKDKDAVQRFNRLLNTARELDKENDELRALIERASKFIDRLQETQRLNDLHTRQITAELTQTKSELKSSKIFEKAWSRTARANFGLPAQATAEEMLRNPTEQGLLDIFREHRLAVVKEINK